MEGNTKEVNSLNRQIWISSLKKTAKILIICLVIAFYLMAISFFMFPRVSAKVFNFMGLTNAEEASYVQAYENSGEIEDLYNLVLFEQQHEEYEKELYYINVLMKFDDYEEFCDKLNKSAINAVSDSEKYMISYVGDTNDYLINRKVKCMYYLNSKNAYENRSNSVAEFVRQQLKSGDEKETSFSTYVTLVLNDESLTENQKTETLNTFAMLTSTENTEETDYLINARIETVSVELALNNNEVEEILLQNALVKLYKAEYQMKAKIGADESALSEIESLYDEAVQRYNELTK